MTVDYWPKDDDRFSVSSKLKKRFGIGIGTRTYPNQFTYRYQSGTALNQGSYGICFICTACNFAKLIVWAYTGKNLSIDRETAAEIGELGGGDRYNGGWHSCCSGLLKYNGSNECVKLFQDICDDTGITETTLGDGPAVACTKEHVIEVLNGYGPFYWAHNPDIYGAGDGSHAILGIGYDKDYFYFKNSWSSSNDDSSYRLYGKVPWSDFRGFRINGYNKKIWSKL